MTKRLLPAQVQVSRGHFFSELPLGCRRGGKAHPFLSFSGLLEPNEEQKLLKGEALTPEGRHFLCLRPVSKACLHESVAIAQELTAFPHSTC